MGRTLNRLTFKTMIEILIISAACLILLVFLIIKIRKQSKESKESKSGYTKDQKKFKSDQKPTRTTPLKPYQHFSPPRQFGEWYNSKHRHIKAYKRANK